MSPLSHSWSVHPHILDKPPVWEPRFGYGWRRSQGSLADLRAHITKGGAFIAAAMSSDHRTAAAFESTSIVAIDIDHGLTLLDFAAHPLRGSAFMVYTTASHRPEAGAHRFRVLFQLSEPVLSGELTKAIITILTHSLGGDRSCTDPTRLFYGNAAAEVPHWYPDHVLDEAILDDAKAYLVEQKAASARASSENDEGSILRAIHVLEQVIDPTADGQRDRFIRISAAARSGGDDLFPAWSDWASRSHHGSGAKKNQSGERFWRGLKGTSLGTLFFLASEDNPDWRAQLPEALRNYDGPSFVGHTDAYAGYGLEDYMGDPDVTVTSAPTPSMFDPQAPWAAVAVPSGVGYDDSDYMGEDGDVIAKGATPANKGEPAADAPKRGPGRPKKIKNDPVETLMARLRNLFPGIRLNIATDQVEFGPSDSPQTLPDPTTIYIRASRGTGDLFAKTVVNDLIQVVAYEQRYNPVKAYLSACLGRATPCPYAGRIATTLLGVADDPAASALMGGQHIADAIMERFMIAAVARVMQPGCDAPWMPVLVGGQNVGKTAFWRHLTPPQGTGPDWTVTMQQGISLLKDRPHILHAGWVVVLDEIERYFQRRFVEELKNLVSTAKDYSAKKYQNEAHYPRSFVLAGATNNADFLVDPSGNRRFLPIVVKGTVASFEDSSVKIIDLDRLQRDRDSLWAAAYESYLAGRTWQFSSYELVRVSEYINGFTADTPSDHVVHKTLERLRSGYHRGRGFVYLSELLDQMGVHVRDYRTMTQPTTDELKRLGWTGARILVGGKLTRVWQAPLEAEFKGGIQAREVSLTTRQQGRDSL